MERSGERETHHDLIICQGHIIEYRWVVWQDYYNSNSRNRQTTSYRTAATVSSLLAVQPHIPGPLSSLLPCMRVLLCCCFHINSHDQVRGHRTGSSHSGAKEYPREKIQTNQRWYSHISQPTQFMPPPETYKK